MRRDLSIPIGHRERFKNEEKVAGWPKVREESQRTDVGERLRILPRRGQLMRRRRKGCLI